MIKRYRCCSGATRQRSPNWVCVFWVHSTPTSAELQVKHTTSRGDTISLVLVKEIHPRELNIMEENRGARSAGSGARGSQVRRPLEREPSPSGSEPDTESQRTGRPGAEELDGLQSKRLNTSASPRDE